MATMNFSTANATFRQLLGNGLSYRVPPFQRDYSWTPDEWDDLWQDIVSLFEADGEPAHYLGYLVLQSSDNRQFDVIDGQQRLATISVMILAVLGHLGDLAAAQLDADDNNRRKDQFRSSYIGYLDPVTLVPRSKLELNRHNNRFYQTYLVSLDKLPQRGLNASEHLLRKSFAWFKDQIKNRYGMTEESGVALASFLDALVDKLHFTVITVTDELNAFKVFETLNSRGVRLSSTDLLKNYLFSIISTQNAHETELKALEEGWESIVDMLGSESFPEFLRVFWNSRNKLARKSDLFKTIRKKINARDKAFELLRTLDRAARVYAALRDPLDESWNAEEKRCLEQLAMFNVRQPLALLMACHDKHHESQRQVFTRIMRAVAIASFRYNVICNLPTHEQERLYNEIARNVSDEAYASPAQIFAALREVHPDDSQFKAAFSTKEFRTSNSRNKKVVRYILFEMERQLHGGDFDFESDSYTLEHVLPEHPSEAWSYLEEARQERMIHRIGNMAILEASKNRDLGNGSYASKRPAYQSSSFKTTKAIAEHYDHWDEKKVDARQSKMAEVACSIWKFEFGARDA